MPGSATPSETTPSPSRPAGPRPAGDLRVLLVEDNAGDRLYFAELLRARGYAVTACADGESAWEAFRREPAPLVLLDVFLPGMDGVELCRRIRAHEAGSECAVLAVTGKTDPEILGRILVAGANDFLRKPVDPRRLDIRLIIAERWVAERRERRATRAELAEKTRELETLFDNLPDAFFSVDLAEERLIQISPAAERILDHEPRELKEDPELWKRLLFPGDGPEDPWGLIREGELSGPLVQEHELASGAGTTRHLRTSLRVAPGPDGTPARVDGVVSDITHQRRITDQLTRRNQELATLNRMAEISLAASSSADALDRILEEVTGALDLPVGAIEHLDEDRSCLVVAATRGTELPTGPDAETPLHRSLAGEAVRRGQPVVEHDPARIREEGPVYLRSDELGVLGAFPLLVGNDPRGVLVVAGPDPGELGRLRTALGTNLANAVAGHVERMETEDALREKEARYRRLVAELKQANAELEAFAYSISHDLRAPLRTMQGFAHALLQKFGGELDQEARDYARRIIASGKESEELIGDLLEYSRLSLEKLELKPVELESAVESALDRVRADTEEAAARITVEKPLPAVRGSRTILVQVLANLLSNAVKFVPDGRTPEVTVRSEERGDEVRLWVEDNGVGIPRGQEERIFRVFERLVGSDDRPGTGIGLAIVRRGMQRVGGSSGVESRPEGGAAFWIQLPGRSERRSGWRPWRRRR